MIAASRHARASPGRLCFPCTFASQTNARARSLGLRAPSPVSATRASSTCRPPLPTSRARPRARTPHAERITSHRLPRQEVERTREVPLGLVEPFAKLGPRRGRLERRDCALRGRLDRRLPRLAHQCTAALEVGRESPPAPMRSAAPRSSQRTQCASPPAHHAGAGRRRRRDTARDGTRARAPR